MVRVTNLLGRDLHAEVTARDHDAVGGGEDLIELVEALLVLDLGDDLDVLALGAEGLPDEGDVGGALHERGGHEVDAALDAEVLVRVRVRVTARVRVTLTLRVGAQCEGERLGSAAA